MNTNPEDLQFMIKYAHQKGVKVAGHLCSITYQEAAMMGIDAIEHGFTYSYDHAEGNKKYITEILVDQTQMLVREPDPDGMQGGSPGGQAQAGSGEQAPAAAQAPAASQAPAATQAPSAAQVPEQNQSADKGPAAASDSFDDGDNGPDDLPF